MAIVKVFDSKGVKELQCFETLVEVPYLEPEEVCGAPDDTEASE